MNRKSVVFGLLVILALVSIGIIYQDGWRHWFGLNPEIEQVEITIDSFDSNWRFSSDSCERTNYILSLHNAQADSNLFGLNREMNERFKGTFFSTNRNIQFVRPTSDQNQGSYSVELTNEQATIYIDRDCWKEDIDNILSFNYGTLRQIPELTHLKIPVIEKDGEFKLLIEFYADPSFACIFRPLITTLTDDPFSFATTLIEIGSTGELLIPLNIDNSQPDLSWKDLTALSLILSGHGKLVLGPPQLLSQ
jgi:hypothetical protein